VLQRDLGKKGYELENKTVRDKVSGRKNTMEAEI
jgi:hypothetical protein